MKQSSFSTNICITEPFNLDYVIRFYKPKNELSSANVTIKILVAETKFYFLYFLAIFYV